MIREQIPRDVDSLGYLEPSFVSLIFVKVTVSARKRSCSSFDGCQVSYILLGLGYSLHQEYLLYICLFFVYLICQFCEGCVKSLIFLYIVLHDPTVKYKVHFLNIFL